MADTNYRILGSTLSSIAEAVRNKTGRNDPMYPTEFAEAINSITGGGGSSADVRYVTFMSEDGTEELCKRAVLPGNDCGDVVALGLVEEQTKEPTNTEIFTRSGYALTAGGEAVPSALKNVTEDRTVYVAFEASTRYYTVRFFDGEELVHTVYAQYGTSVDYTLEDKDGGFFNGWSPAPTNIIADMDCYAQWAEKEKFSTATFARISEICEAGEASDYFAVNDEREIMGISGTTYVLRIVGIEFDNKADGSGKAGLTVAITKKDKVAACFAPFSRSGYRGIGWAYVSGNSGSESNVRYYLRDTFIDDLPSDLQSVIKTVTKNTEIGNDSTFSLQTSEDQLFVPSLEEFGNPSFRADISEGLGAYPGFNTAETRKLYNSDGSAANVWTRCVNYVYPNSCAYYLYDGSPKNAQGGWYNLSNQVSNSQTSVSAAIYPCFCI